MRRRLLVMGALAALASACTGSSTRAALDGTVIHGTALVAEAGGTGTIAVTASAATCAWTATANAVWLTVTGGASGTGTGTVAFTAAANTGAARTGTLTIGAQTFTVSQAAAPPAPCTFTISPTTQSVANTGGSGSIAVTASTATCAWTAISAADWIVVADGASRTGSGTTTFNVTANSGAARSGTIAVAGQTFTVTQEQRQD